MIGPAVPIYVTFGVFPKTNLGHSGLSRVYKRTVTASLLQVTGRIAARIRWYDCHFILYIFQY